MKIILHHPLAVLNRTGAAVMDLFLISVAYGLIVGAVTGNYTAMLNRFNVSTGSSLYDILLVLGLMALYFIGLPLLWEGATVGKRLTRTRLVTVDGKPPGLGTLVLRFLVLVVPNVLLLGIPAIAAIYMMLFRRDNRGYHDLLARTKVAGLG
ncbi:RDD family protein [Ectobacillus ponti]|uniref:RDD family protein n=1 Tax=Ectobacillus ponti TaxID=2961894 RepID=A0AA41XEY5_9BACI|nr:RDD family protein [Ectobacillus ponti]MCP8970861.1 RDD family protein [Ectobacillus ponti]